MRKIQLIARRAACIAAAAILPVSLAAPAFSASPVSVHGFGTLGLVYNATDHAEFIRDPSQSAGVSGWGTKADTLAGLQVNYKPNPLFEAVVQGVSEYNSDGNYKPDLTWAFLKYAPTSDIDLRAGRLGLDAYMLADSRDIGYSYLWVRPPIEYFGTLQLSHLDGADILVRQIFGDTLTTFKIYAGRADEELPIGLAENYDLKGSDVYGAYIGTQTNHWQFRLGFIGARLQHDLPPPVSILLDGMRASTDPATRQFAEDFYLKNKTLFHYSFGAVYENGAFQAQWLYDYATSNSRAYPDHNSAIWLVGYRIQKWTPYALAAGTWLHDFDDNAGVPAGDPYYAAANLFVATTRFQQTSLSLGVRYDVMPNVDIKLQASSINAKYDPSFFWRNTEAGWDGDTVVFSAVLDFVF
jgi:hypothetical protein